MLPYISGQVFYNDEDQIDGDRSHYYSERVLGEYAKGIDSPDDFGDAFKQLDRLCIDGKINKQFRLEHYYDEFYSRIKEVQFYTAYRDDIVILLRNVSTDMQDQENSYFIRMDLARLAALRREGNGERNSNHEEMKKTVKELKWNKDANFR